MHTPTSVRPEDSRWVAAGYVLAPGNTRKRVRVPGATRKDAMNKLTEKIAASNRGVPIPSAAGSVTAYLTYWLENIAIHPLRENIHTRYTACVHRHLILGLGKKLTKLIAKDVRIWFNQLRTTCQCCHERLSPLTLTYTHSVLKSALEHACARKRSPATWPATSAPAPHDPDASNPSPLTKPAHSSPPPRATGCTRCSNSPSTPDSARANSSVTAGKTSTSTAALPPSTAPSRAPAARAYRVGHQDSDLRATHRPPYRVP